MSGKQFTIAAGEIEREKASDFSHIYTDNMVAIKCGENIHVLLGINAPDIKKGEVVNVKAIDRYAIIFPKELARIFAAKLNELVGPDEKEAKAKAGADSPDPRESDPPGE